MQQELLQLYPDNKCGVHRYDIEAVRSVRQFKGHMDRITDLRMSADARWLLSSSLDGTLRVWDVPSARCLQVRPPCRQGAGL